MNKNAILAFITFLIIFSISKGGSFFLIKTISDQTTKVVKEAIAEQDSLQAAIQDTIKTEEKKDDLGLDLAIIKELRREIDKNFDFTRFRKLKKSEVDSLKKEYLGKIDNILRDKKKLISLYNEKKEEKSQIKDSLLIAREDVQKIKDENKRLLEKKKEEISREEKKAALEKEKMQNESYTKLAQTYNNMKPARVAQILMNLDNETITEILDRMNERKVGKVLEAMPVMRATILAKYVTGK